MGNGGAKLTRCLSLFRRPAAALPSNSSFSYAFPLSSSFKSRLPSFRSISGAALSANLHTPSAFRSSFEPLDLLHSAQGLAGEDRLHLVLSPDHTSLFVGIYDGFNGPDAADFLLSNLYPAVHLHLAALQRPGRRHTTALRALSRALRDTERAFLDAADSAVSENPELALMGSCVLVLLLKNDDLYLMNVGDSRAVLAQEMAEDEPPFALQLTRDHCTCVEEEVSRIRSEHPEDALAVMNNRVKGSLKVTRAFGAGFLKQPSWNNALLEMFRVNYVGTSPYINCSPFLCHHRLCSRDRFLILSSDGLFQYFSNEEAVAEVESFAETTPGGDPAQHLAHQLLIRAAKNAGMDFRELIEIPRGDRRRYHDDVSIIIISFHGRRIWNSCT